MIATGIGGKFKKNYAKSEISKNKLFSTLLFPSTQLHLKHLSANARC